MVRGRVVILFILRDTGLLGIFYGGTMYSVSKQSYPELPLKNGKNKYDIS